MSACTGSQAQINAKLFALINELFCALKDAKAPVTDCLRVTVPGAWGDYGDIIQHIKWFNNPPTSYVDVYINTTQNKTVLGVTTENTTPCEQEDEPCCNNIDFQDTESISVHDCGEFYRTISFDVNISDDAPPPNILESHADGLYAQILRYTGANAVVFYADTVDGADTGHVTWSGGGNSATYDPLRGGAVSIYGNESPIGLPGGVEINLGNVANAAVAIGYGGGATSRVELYANSTLQVQTANGFALNFKNSANENTGGSSVNLGANSPATIATPYKWLKCLLSDGTTAWTPFWK